MPVKDATQRFSSRVDNYVRFRLSPTVAIAIGARAKRPGEGMQGQLVELSVVEGAEQNMSGRMGAYERLLGDAVAGDATLFARQDVVEAVTVELVEAAPVAGALRFKLVRHASAPAQKARQPPHKQRKFARGRQSRGR